MQLKAGWQAFKVALIYVMAAGAWILFSDQLLAWLVSDPHTRVRLSIFKGWVFVIVTGGLLYLLVRRLLRLWSEEAEKRQQAENNLHPTERALHTLIDCNQALVRAPDEPALLQDICQVIVTQGGYRLAWVGFAENDAAKSVRIAASAGFDAGYVAEAKISWDETSERGGGPVGLALRTGQLAVIQDFKTDAKTGPWQAAAAKRGYAAAIVLPLRNAEKSFGVLTLYAAEANAFQPAQIELLAELADNLAFGIQSLRTRFERELAAAALHASESRLQFLLSATPAIIYSLRPIDDFATTFVSENVRAVLGYEAQAFNHDPMFWLAHVHPDDVSAAAASFAELPVANAISREYRFRHRDGTYRWMHDEMRVVRDAQGQPLEFVGYWFDITERKQAEQVLRESEQKFAKMFHSSPTSMTLSTVELGRYLDVNTEYLRLHGWSSREEVIGRTALERGVWADPGQRTAVIARLKQGELVRNAEADFLTRSGERRHVLWSVEEVVIGGEHCLLGSALDITEWKQAETKLEQERNLLRTLIDHLPDMVYVRDTASRFLVANPALIRRMGGSTAADLIGKTDADFYPPEVAAQYLAHDQTIFAGGEMLDRECVIDFPNGERLTVVGAKVPLKNAHGEVIGLVGVIHDITEEKIAEQKLRENEAKYKDLFDNAPVGFHEVDTEGRLVRINNTELKMLGYTAEELLGQYVWSYSATADISRQAALAKLSGTMVPLPFFERKFRRQDGSVFPVMLKDRLLKRADGTIVGIRTAVQDITPQKEAEDKLRESEQRYRQLFDLESDAVVLVDYETHRYVDVNQAAQQLYGYSREEFLQLKPEDVSTEPAATRDNINAGEIHVPLRWHRKKNGERFAVEITANQIEFKGRRTALVALRDVTVRQQVLERLQETTQQLLEAQRIARLGSYVFDVVTDRWTCSEVLDELFGVAGSDFTKDVAGWLKIVHPEEREGLRHYLEDHVLSGRNVFDRTYRIIRQNDRQERWVHGLGKVFFDDHGHAVQMVGIIQDITERKLAESLMRRSEERYRNLVNNARDAIFTIATDGTFTSLNPAVENIAGVPRGEWLGQPFGPMVHPDDLPLAEEMFRRILSGVQVPVHELRGHPALNRPAVMEMTLAAMQDESGAITGVLGIGRDITERKHAEAALKESQALYHSLVAQLPIGIFRKDQAGRYVLVNAGFCRLKGMAAEHFLGKTPVEVAASEMAKLDAAGLTVKYAAAGWDHHQLIMQTGKTIEFDEEYSIAQGRKCFIHAMKMPVLNPDGKVVGTQGILFDVTERKHAEEQMHLQFSALTAAANAIVITDRQGKIEWVNPSFTKLSGYTSQETIGGSPRLLKSGQHPRGFYANLWSTILTGNVWHGELVNKRKDGRLYTEDMTITPVRGTDGLITHFVAIKQDVTGRRQFENRLQQAQKMEAIGTLAGGIAHDFNNILAAMFGYGYLLQQDTEGNPGAQESIAEILKATSRAKDLVQQILTFSRQRESSRQVIRLDTVVKEAMKFLRASLPTNIRIDLNLAPDAPAVLADPTQIYQVTINLATNALHAMEGRAGRLALGLAAFQPDAEFLQTHPEFHAVAYARLTVTDNGHGMDAKTLARIFEPFFTTKPVGKGTGLGLAVVHGIIQSHQGAITVESQPGEGTTFCLYFPAQAQDAVATESVSSQLPQGNGQKILLVDDEPALTSMFQRVLVRLNYQVVTCNHPREAVRLFRQNPAQFALVITDLTMPEINGLELARQFRALRPDLPIILASGYSAELNPENLLEAGIRERVDKPVSLAALAEVVHRVLAKT